nr:GNAT family N-acetyltransferase [Paucisalibacillus globulus]
MKIKQMGQEDWEAVREIYLEGIHTGNATFDIEPPTREEWDKGHVKSCRLVARLDEQIVGWAALSQTTQKKAYRGVAEDSIYVSSACSGMGVGATLLEELVRASEESGFWTLQALIFAENIASIKLHLRFGFDIVGTRKRVGQLNGVWRDVVFLERRSSIVGID